MIGLDTYQGNGPVTAARLAPYSFAIFKLTEGTTVDESAWAVPAARLALSLGMPTAFYHYGRAGSGADQAAYFDMRIPADLMGNVGMALDVETFGEMDPVEARAFVDAMHGWGYRVGLYGSDSTFTNCGQDWSWVARYGRWVPTYRGWDVWQYRAVAGEGDLNQFYGTADELRALWLPGQGGGGSDVSTKDLQDYFGLNNGTEMGDLARAEYAYWTGGDRPNDAGSGAIYDAMVAKLGAPGMPLPVPASGSFTISGQGVIGAGE